MEWFNQQLKFELRATTSEQNYVAISIKGGDTTLSFEYCSEKFV
jgi:hypothetical protein